MNTSPDTAAVERLLVAYFAAVDDHRLTADLAAATFADDAVLTRPNGAETTGPSDILASHTASFARFRATQHLIANVLVDITGDDASVRANLQAMHVWNPDHIGALSLQTYFVAGGVLRADARRTDAGWRLTALGNDVRWRTGTGTPAMLATS